MRHYLASLTLLLASCATIMSGETSTVQVRSTEPGVEFRTSTGLYGITPMSVELPNGTDVTFFWKEGDDPRTGISSPSISPWIVGNLLFGGIVGFAIDLVAPQSRVHPSPFTLGGEPVEDSPKPDRPLSSVERRQQSTNLD